MSDSLTTQSGTLATVPASSKIATDECTTLGHYQLVKLTDGTADSEQVISSGNGTSTAALRVTISSDSTGQVKLAAGANAIGSVSVSGVSGTTVVAGGGTAGSASAGVVTIQGIASMTPVAVSASSLPLPTGASTAAKQPALGTAGSASSDVITVQGVTSMTPLLATVTGSVTANAGTNLNTSALALETGGNLATIAGAISSSVVQGNVKQVNGVTTQTGTGTAGTGTQRVAVASDSSIVLATGANTIGALTANQSVNAAQINGVTPLMGAGNTGTGSLRVTIASDQAAVATTETVGATIYNGVKTVTTAGTRVTLASSQAVKTVTIKALATNTGTIYVGSSAVSSANGFQLLAGETVSLDVANLSTVNIDSSVNGEGVAYIGVGV